MELETIKVKVFSRIAAAANIPFCDVLPDSTVESLKLDSLDVVEVVLALEDDFEVEIDDGSIEGLRTVRQVVDHVAKLVAQKAA